MKPKRVVYFAPLLSAMLIIGLLYGLHLLNMGNYASAGAVANEAVGSLTGGDEKPDEDPQPQGYLPFAAYQPLSVLISVTTTNDELNDDGDCSLREAIQTANTDLPVDACPVGSVRDTIVLSGGVYKLKIEHPDGPSGEDRNVSGDLDITSRVTISGSKDVPTILDGNRIDRVLEVLPGAVVTIAYMTIRNGQPPPLQCCEDDDAGDGGGIANWGRLFVTHSTVHANKAGSDRVTAFHDGSDGGGIWNAGVLAVANSTISGNKAGNGFGASSHGGILHYGRGGDGGGIVNLGSLILNNVTIANNHPGQGYCETPTLCFPGRVGGIYNGFGSIDIKNTIIVYNENFECSGEMNSQGFNLIEDVTDCTVNSGVVVQDAALGPLADNGGPTLTHALLSGSPAIDAGSCIDSWLRPVTIDQRGEPRPQGANCDIGAYEAPATQ